MTPPTAPGRWSAIGAVLTLLLAISGCIEASETPSATPHGSAATQQSFELGGYRYFPARATQWALPGKGLREVSGLTLDPEGRLFAHDDELAVIYQLDYQNHEVVKAFALGDPPVKGDFEGIAWAEGQLYLVTSDGDLLVSDEGEHGEYLPYQRHVTRLGQRCEVEGLHYDAPQRLLRLACKTIREPGSKKRTLVLAWSLDTASPAPEHDLELLWPEPAEAAAAGAEGLLGDGSGPRRRLHLSGITWSPRAGNWIAVAHRQRALVEFAPDGTLVRAFQIPNTHLHPQMEGIALTADGTLIIADEGGKGRGRLSVYPADE
ncbi:MAG: SdiA-regulated domain-containing protein [Pseudomonadales bacterium]